MDDITQALITQIEDAMAFGNRLKDQATYDDLSDLKSNAEPHQFVVMAKAAVRRATGRDSVYTEQINQLMEELTPTAQYRKTHIFLGILAAAKDAVEKGYIHTVKELIHANLFADYLEMADHLLANGYKDAAAVITGSSLEAQLRQLADKNGIGSERITSQGDSVPKKASMLNSDLARAKIYSKLDQKNVTAWLDLRNSAAHGKYDSYQVEQVRMMTSWTRDFISRMPA